MVEAEQVQHKATVNVEVLAEGRSTVLFVKGQGFYCLATLGRERERECFIKRCMYVCLILKGVCVCVFDFERCVCVILRCVCMYYFEVYVCVIERCVYFCMSWCG